MILPQITQISSKIRSREGISILEKKLIIMRIGLHFEYYLKETFGIFA